MFWIARLSVVIAAKQPELAAAPSHTARVFLDEVIVLPAEVTKIGQRIGAAFAPAYNVVHHLGGRPAAGHFASPA